MAVYVVAQLRVDNREMLDQYVEKVVRTIRNRGGWIIGFDETPDVIEGRVEHPRTVIIQFDTKEAFRAWYDSPEYQAIIPLRQDSAPGSVIVVNGLGAPARS